MVSFHLFITDPIKAAKLLQDSLPFDIELMILHGSVVCGNYSKESDIDLLVAVNKQNQPIADTKLREFPRLDVILMDIEDLIKKAYEDPDIYYSIIKYGKTLINKNRYRERILEKGMDLNILKNKLQETNEILNVIGNFLDIVESSDTLWGCSFSLWNRYKILYNINTLLLNSEPSKAVMYSEAERFGLQKDVMPKIHNFHLQVIRGDQINQKDKPTKDLLFDVLKVIKKYKIEVENNINSYTKLRKI